MRSAVVALVVFAFTFGGALGGMFLGARLPPHHVDKGSQNLVKLGMGTIATLMALVLGLLVGTAKSSFDSTATQTREFAAKLVQLDHVLWRYGPETNDARRALKGFLAVKIAQLWPPRGAPAAPPTTSNMLLDEAAEQILALSPHTAMQKQLQARAVQLIGDLGQTRWLLLEQLSASAIPTPFLVVLVFWATILFTSFGLFAPRHATAVSVLLVCALSIAAAIFIILELARPFGGIIHIPKTPALNALASMR